MRCSGSNAELRHSAFSEKLAGDAIAERFRSRSSSPPQVDPLSPDVLVDLRVGRERCSAGIDLAGRSLHQRGRGRRVRAPLREDIAAGLALLAGIGPETPLLDPFCGSGTLIAEAAAIALRRVPDRDPARMPLSRLPPFSGLPFAGLREELFAREVSRSAQMLAFDADPRAVSEARELLASRGLASRIEVRRAEVAALDLPELAEAGTLITNPPWGRRLARDVESAWRSLGTLVRRPPFSGWTLAVLSGHPELTRHLGLASTRRWPVRVAGTDARLCIYAIRPPRTNGDAD